MSFNEQYPNHPWDDGVYGTGRTQPPKSHGGVIAVLLILVIFLSGLVSVLGILNVRLFRQLNEKNSADDLPISFAAETGEDTVAVLQTDPSQELVPTESEPEVLLPAAETVPELRLPASTFGAQQEGLPLQEIYEQCIPSVVSIICGQRSGSSTGTGVILSEDGYIVTNYHVIEEAQKISVQLTDDRTLQARLVGSDPASDLAVLHIDGDGLVPAQLGDSEVLRVGDSVVAIGDPLGVEYRGTMTDGIVSAINRNMTVNGRTMNLIQTNAALNSGNSGGPLINCLGQVIGINTVKIGAFTDKAGVEGIGFAIPSTTVRAIVEQIIAQGYVSGRPYLGLTGESISIFYQRYYRMPSGLYITEVEPGCQAEQKGIASGDILISVDGTKVYSQSDLETLLYRYSAGDTVTLIIYRSGYTYEVSLTLEEATGGIG